MYSDWLNGLATGLKTQMGHILWPLTIQWVLRNFQESRSSIFFALLPLFGTKCGRACRRGRSEGGNDTQGEEEGGGEKVDGVDKEGRAGAEGLEGQGGDAGRHQG